MPWKRCPPLKTAKMDLLKDELGHHPITYGDVTKDSSSRDSFSTISLDPDGETQDHVRSDRVAQARHSVPSRKTGSKEQPREILLTSPIAQCSKERLDYMFLLQPNEWTKAPPSTVPVFSPPRPKKSGRHHQGKQESSEEEEEEEEERHGSNTELVVLEDVQVDYILSIKPGSSKVRPFFVDGPGNLTQLSDHYAVETVIQSIPTKDTSIDRITIKV